MFFETCRSIYAYDFCYIYAAAIFSCRERTCYATDREDMPTLDEELTIIWRLPPPLNSYCYAFVKSYGHQRLLLG